MKILLIRRVRLVTAAIVFVCLLAAFLDFRDLLPDRLPAAVADVQFVPALLRALAGAGAGVLIAWVLITLVAGRLYCSVACPLGIFQDLVWRLRQWLFPRRLRFVRAANPVRFGILFLSVAACLAGAWSVLAMLDPYSHFGRIASGILRPAVLALNNQLVPVAEAAGFHGLWRVPMPPLATFAVGFAAASLALLTVLAAWRGRLFCNTLCPVGALLGFFSSRALLRLEMNKTLCGKCGECMATCKAQCINLQTSEIDFSRCILCYDCVAVCDQQAISYRRPVAPASAARAASDPALRRNLKALAAGLVVMAFPEKLRAAKRIKKREWRASPRGDLAAPIMPPGATSLPLFLSRCTACGLCIANCPTQALQPAFLEYGWPGILKPHLDPSSGYCNYDCTICIELCPTGALVPLALDQKKRTQCGVAHFDKSRCIVFTNGTDCAACSEHCPTKAVDTKPFRRNLLLPEVNEALCIGCGACEFACPVRPERAIRVSGRSVQPLLPAAPALPQRTGTPPPNDFPF
jgi:polyferredoxin